MANDAELKIRISAQIGEIKSALDQLQRELTETGAAGERGGARASAGMDRLAAGARRVALQIGAVVAAYATIRTGTAIIKAADDFQRLEARLKLVTKSEEEYQRARAETFRIAQQAGQEISGTIDLYTSLARATGSLGASQESVLRVTETFNKILAISGAGAEQAASGTLQFTQALASTRIQADELNGILDATRGEFGAIVERGLGITAGTLREFARTVGISNRELFGALLRESERVDGVFEEIPDTVAKATQRIRNDLTRLSGSVDLRGLVAAINDFRNIITDPAIIEAIGQIAQAMVSGFGGAAKIIAGLNFIFRGATDEAVKLDDKIRDVDRRLAQLGPRGATTDRGRQLLAERAELIAQQEAIYQAQADANRAGREQARERAAALQEESDRLREQGDAERERQAAAEEAADAAKRRAEAIKDLIQSLTDEAAEHGKTRAEVAAYRAEQLGASAATIERARALGQSIDALEAEEKAQKDAAKAAEERAKRDKEVAGELAGAQIELLRLQGDAVAARELELSERFDELLADLIVRGNETGVALIERLIRTDIAKTKLDELRADIAEAIGAFDQAQENAANRVLLGATTPAAGEAEIDVIRQETIDKLIAYRAEMQGLSREDFPEAAAEAAEVEAQILRLSVQGATGLKKAAADLGAELQRLKANFAADSFGALADSLTDLFVDLATNAKSGKEALEDFVRSFAQAMAQITARILATAAVVQLINLLPGGAAILQLAGLSANVKHGGGLAGSGPTRQVPRYIFAAAARYHDGGLALRDGEVPAILQVGEEVLKRSDPRHVLNGGLQGGGPTEISLRNILVDRRESVNEHIGSGASDRVLLEFIDRNGESIARKLPPRR